MITKNMENFISKNKTNKVVSGERRTSENKELLNTSDINNSNIVQYRFDDDTEVLLTNDDINSAPEYLPVWDL